jgi:hypothetical protein
MGTKEGIWEVIQDLLAKAFTKSNFEWFEKTLGVKTDKFFEHVAIETIAVLSATAIIAFVGVVGSRHIWRAIHRKFRAATIRKTSSTAFVIVRCPIANDSNEAIGNEIAARLETAFRAFAGWGAAGGRPFHVMGFPLALSGDEGTKEYDKAIETAKRWLERTDGDILIWGKRVKGESVGIVRLIGKDRKKGVIEMRRVDFDKRGTDFDQALANAIAYEAAQLTQITLSEPELLNLETLREVSSKLERLAASDAPALSPKWRERMAAEHWRLTEQIVRRTPGFEELKELESQARLAITALDPVKQPHRFAVTALRIVILIRKTNWLDPNPGELDEARALIDRAIPVLESVGSSKECGEAALERAAIRRQQLLFKKSAEFEDDEIYRTDFHEARRLIDLAKDESLSARLMAAGCSYPTLNALTDALGSDTDEPSVVFAFVDRLASHLDNEELFDLLEVLRFWIFQRGDQALAAGFWRAAPELLQGALNSRSSWTKDERRLLLALISLAALATAFRMKNHLGDDDAATLYYHLANRAASSVIDSLDWKVFVPHRYVELRTIRYLGISVFHLSQDSQFLDRALRAMRAVAGPSAARFQRLQRLASGTLIVTLNNYAAAFRSLDAAKEAWHHVDARNRELELEGELFAQHQYVAAYAAWQIARLTPRDDVAARAEWSRRAHDIAEEALRHALDEGDQVYASDANTVLREVEADFPELALDVEAAMVADEEAKKIEALSKMSPKDGKKN